MATITDYFVKDHHSLLLIEEEQSEDNFDKLMQKYSTIECIPLNFVEKVMSNYFPSHAMINQYGEKYFQFHVSAKDLILSFVNGHIINWQYNRPADKTRCPVIAQHIYNNKIYIDTQFSLSFNAKLCKFEIIDGNHRLNSLKLLYQDYMFDGLDWLFVQKITTNVRFNATEGELIEAFKTLNKSQPVPELYVREPNQNAIKICVINSVADYYIEKYKKHFTSSSRPQIGNSNRCLFVELLDRAYDKVALDDYNNIQNVLTQRIDYVNAYIKEFVPMNKLSMSLVNKCSQTGCYLFTIKYDEVLRLV